MVRIVLLITFAEIILTSCIGTRYLEPNEYILAKDPNLHGLPGRYKNDVENLYEQKANSKLLGILPVKPQVYLHQWGQNIYDSSKYAARINKIEKKFDKKIEKAKSEKRKEKLIEKKTEKADKLKEKIESGNWLMRNFESLVVYDSSKHEKTVNKISLFLETKGYFRNRVKFEENRLSGTRKSVDYYVNTGSRYRLDSIIHSIEDKKIAKFLDAQNPAYRPLKKGLPYDQEILEKEREYIFTALSNNGYYAFSRQYISFRLDTATLDDQGIIIREIISNPKGEKEHNIYTIDSVIFTSESSVANRQDFTTEYYGGTTYRFGTKEYKEKILDWRLFIRNDSTYSRENTLETQRQLSYLDAFKFVNINYDTVGTALYANIFTSPLNKFQTSNEFGLISSSISQQFPGPFLNLSLKNRNAFNGLEIIELAGNFSLLGINNIVADDEDSQNSNPYSLFQYGARLSLTFPQFLFPTGPRFKRKIGSYNPSTRISFGYNYEDRVGEYERSRINSSIAYSWRVDDSNLYTLTPFALGFTEVTKLEPSFQEFLNEQEALGNGALPAAFRSAFVSSTSFEAGFNRNDYGSNTSSSSYFRVFAETGGNLINLLGEKTFAGDLSLFRWAKLQFDFREILPLNPNTIFAYRLNFGVAYPYGSNPSLPYEKRFFIGGSNSVRAWPIRRLGPGAYGLVQDTETDQNASIDRIQYSLEQGGDMIFEMSAEIRKPLIGFIDYALFLDAGNIWIVNSDVNLDDQPDSEGGDDGVFRFNSFFRELAIGAGLGLRLDFSFLIFRLDGAVQVVDPAQKMGNRFVLDDLNLLAPFNGKGNDTFRNKTSLNLGIGFPF